MNNLVASVKFTGRIGCVGVFVPEDPNSEDKLGRVGKMPFKSLGTGQCNVKAYNRFLSKLIEKDKVRPSFIVSHELPLEQAPEGYENFDKRKQGWTKVVLKPGR